MTHSPPNVSLELLERVNNKEMYEKNTFFFYSRQKMSFYGLTSVKIRSNLDESDSYKFTTHGIFSKVFAQTKLITLFNVT